MFPEMVVTLAVLFAAFIGFLVIISRFYRKVGPDEAIVRTIVPHLKSLGASGIVEFPISKIID